jgi:hypothetical protein
MKAHPEKFKLSFDAEALKAIKRTNDEASGLINKELSGSNLSDWGSHVEDKVDIPAWNNPVLECRQDFGVTAYRPKALDELIQYRVRWELMIGQTSSLLVGLNNREMRSVWLFVL